MLSIYRADGILDTFYPEMKDRMIAAVMEAIRVPSQSVDVSERRHLLTLRVGDCAVVRLYRTAGQPWSAFIYGNTCMAIDNAGGDAGHDPDRALFLKLSKIVYQALCESKSKS